MDEDQANEYKTAMTRYSIRMKYKHKISIQPRSCVFRIHNIFAIWFPLISCLSFLISVFRYFMQQFHSRTICPLILQVVFGWNGWFCLPSSSGLRAEFRPLRQSSYRPIYGFMGKFQKKIAEKTNRFETWKNSQTKTAPNVANGDSVIPVLGWIEFKWNQLARTSGWLNFTGSTK